MYVDWHGRFTRDEVDDLRGQRHQTPPQQAEPSWTNGQVERINRTIKGATVKRFNYDSHKQLRTQLADFTAPCNFGRRLKILSALTPYEYISKIWT